MNHLTEVEIAELSEQESGCYMFREVFNKPIEIAKTPIERLLLSDGYIVPVEKRNVLKTIKTKQFGVLPVFDSIDEFLETKFNRCTVLFFCSSRNERQTKTNSRLITVSVVDRNMQYEFESITRRNVGIAKNEIEQITSGESYIIVLERNNFVNNGVQILHSHKLKNKQNGN